MRGIAPSFGGRCRGSLLPRPVGVKTSFVSKNAASQGCGARWVAVAEVDYGGINRMAGDAETEMMGCPPLRATRGGTRLGRAVSYQGLGF